MKRNVLRAAAALVLSVIVSPAGLALAEDSRPSTINGTPETCRSAGLPGEILEVTATVRDDTYINITAVPSGYQLTGVAVLGAGKKFNRYLYMGELPWNDLQAPQATPFTKWFACAKPRTSAPTPPATTTSATTTTTTTTTTTSVPSSSSVTVTTTKAPAQADSGLAKTGFNGGWFVFIGAGLLVAGAAALILSRARRRS